jgi:hypothetical protein
MKLCRLQSRRAIALRTQLWQLGGEVRRITVDIIRRTERSNGLVDWQPFIGTTLHQSAEGTGIALVPSVEIPGLRKNCAQQVIAEVGAGCAT